LGGVASAVVAPALAGDLMLACRTVEEAGGLQIGQLVAGLRRNTRSLVMVGVFHLIASLLILMLLTVFIGAMSA
jgi:hypothetical protein